MVCQFDLKGHYRSLKVITPIYKGGTKETINNYRPVCSLSSISKIMEKVIYNRMIKFIDKYNILSTKQYGFRKNMGTDTALINYIDTILTGLNDKLYTVSIFMDLSKAFDVLNLDILKILRLHFAQSISLLERHHLHKT